MIEKIWDYQLTELEKKDWNYVLYKVNGDLLLSVISGGVGLFELNILLNDQQQKEYEKNGSTIIEQIAKEIRENQNKYSKKNIEIRIKKK